MHSHQCICLVVLLSSPLLLSQVCVFHNAATKFNACARRQNISTYCEHDVYWFIKIQNARSTTCNHQHSSTHHLHANTPIYMQSCTHSHPHTLNALCTHTPALQEICTLDMLRPNRGYKHAHQHISTASMILQSCSESPQTIDLEENEDHVHDLHDIHDCSKCSCPPDIATCIECNVFR